MTSNSDEKGGGVWIRFPLPDERLFRNRAIEDVLLLFVRNPHEEFSVTELRNVTGHGGDTIQTAVDVLTAANLVESQHVGRKRLLSANQNRFENPDDPILAIPQSEFHEPVRELVDRLNEQLDGIRGIVLFGSVAEGRADRRSDIDCFVLVEREQARTQQIAHEVASSLGDERFEDDRYEFQVLVESTETASQYGRRLREIFATGITLEDSERLRKLKSEVLADGR